MSLQHVVLGLEQFSLRRCRGNDVIAVAVGQKLLADSLLKTVVPLHRFRIQIAAHILLLPPAQRVWCVDMGNAQLLGDLLTGPSGVPIM